MVDLSILRHATRVFLDMASAGLKNFMRSRHKFKKAIHGYLRNYSRYIFLVFLVNLNLIMRISSHRCDAKVHAGPLVRDSPTFHTPYLNHNSGSRRPFSL